MVLVLNLEGSYGTYLFAVIKLIKNMGSDEVEGNNKR